MTPPKTYKYGMKMRPYGTGCQPFKGLIDVEIKIKSESGFWNILTYERPLIDEEIKKFELIDLNHKS